MRDRLAQDCWPKSYRLVRLIESSMPLPQAHKIPFARVLRSTNQLSIRLMHGAKMQLPPNPYKTPRVTINCAGCSCVSTFVGKRENHRRDALTVAANAAPIADATINSEPNHISNFSFFGYLLQKYIRKGDMP